MKRSLLLGIFFFIGMAVYAGDTLSADNSLIEYTGRIDFENPLAPKFSYSGVSIRTCFTGTSISAILNDDQGENYYNVILDGVVVDTLLVNSGTESYLLADGLDDAIHEIELFKRTELTFGKTEFLGFIVDAGASLQPVSNTRELFIEYIGNSITCGYGNEGPLGETFGPTTENHYLTYAAITSRNFNAKHMAVSRSGIGIYRNYDGPAEGNAECMTNLYSRIFLYDDAPLYDFAVQPDVICINLGTNDYSTTGGDSALYVSNYFRLIDTLQTRYTNPEIVLLAGPMLSGGTLTDIKSHLQYIADSASNKGMGHVSFFELSAQGSLGYAIDYHPTLAQHAKNGAELTAYLKTLMDWKIQPLLTKAKTLSENHVQIEFNTPVYDPQDSYLGFSVYTTEGAFNLQMAYRDTTKENVVHLILEENMAVGETLMLDYEPGTLESQDSVSMKTIKGYPVNNTLTPPDLVNLPQDEEDVQVELFPNPNGTGVLGYHVYAVIPDTDPLTYEILNTSGASLLRGSLLARCGVIDLPRLTSGTYFIRFSTADFSRAESFVVIRN
ncbi:MAG: hypothetical protein JW801_10590 [Bacteroidales bacterium]|nr:hypothetical protein [Bacteroidales bacterium]